MIYRPHHGVQLSRKQIERFSDRDWIREHAIDTYKDTTNLVARLNYPVDGFPEEYVIKWFGWRNTISKILSPVMRSRAKKSWDAAHFFLANNVPTPPPLIVYTSRRYGIVRENFYISESVEEFNSARKILRYMDVPEADKARIVEIIAGMVKRLHVANFTHNDLTLANFLVNEVEPGKIFLVDLNRGTRHFHLWDYHRIKDITKMDLCPCDLDELHPNCYRDQFLRAYSENYERDRRLVAKALVRKRRKKRWKKKLRE
ncbi:MAG: lipopolysaccharide kinase InaA family protein [Candidatus Marinimicrobia bacterium]|nr:lipopolysaccharide kinase InaA family protein [Candidatus Neomarinimicrobiota bacterium]MCF7829241.1 lipopolysaccharide kinase InaA family protein [Candidatus Neomarinimicrobiota bacterium]MCF7881106.1 lipopolysaccharide kinase InaA family protein [Candidatus Neomarinimicrobiota bacterium]